MAVVGKAVTTAIIAAGPKLVGPTWLKVADAVGVSVAQWLKAAGVQATGVTVGVAGGGNVNGKVGVVPSPLPGTIQAAGLVGITAAQIATAVGLGFSSAFNASNQYTGVSAGVGNGVETITKVTTANAGALITILTGNLAAKKIVGLNAAKLAAGIGNGIAAIALTGTGAGVAAGSPSPVPAAGTSKSTVV
jgi:hypothetical protein